MNSSIYQTKFPPTTLEQWELVSGGVLRNVLFGRSTNFSQPLEGPDPEWNRGVVIVMDNYSSHKRPDVRALMEAVGVRLLPPPQNNALACYIRYAIVSFQNRSSRCSARFICLNSSAFMPPTCSIEPMWRS